MPGKPWFMKNKAPNTAQGFLCNENKSNFGYQGFKQYFPEEDKIDVEKTLKKIKTFEDFIGRNSRKYDFVEIKKNKSFTIDYKEIVSDERIVSQWDDFKGDLERNTQHCLDCFSTAMQQKIYTELSASALDESELASLREFNNVNKIHTRIINYEPTTLLKNLKVDCYGKLVSVRGVIIKASNVKLQFQFIAFKCSLCSEVQMVKQNDGAFAIPGKCPKRGCRAQSNFTPLISSPYTKSINLQNIKLQEHFSDEQSDSGRVPQTLDCELSEDLVHSCAPGDDVTLVGIIKIKNTSEESYRNKTNSLFSMYLDAVSVINNTNHSEEGNCTEITFNTTADYYAIQKIHSEPSLFRLLVHSLCPNIYGHEIVKAGLLLALFGGTKQKNCRAESHVLVVGDPGLGKSQMLQACSNVTTPRGVYVCGNVSSSSGLTVTMTRETTGDYALEAGALILADQGCCCIDEFDKMRTQHACLLEVMEQQTISIAKAGVSCNIPVHTTILAAANPAEGHYNKAKTISENLKIGSPMLTRFDLVFILLDQEDERLDVLLSEHILSIHAGFKHTRSSINSTVNERNQNDLRFRLSLQPDECVDYLPHPLFKKYIAYARKYVHPKLSDEARETIKQFYLGVRNQFKNKYCSPLTPRLLCSLVRLTQARAKVELREEATKEDALDVIDIMRNSLVDVFIDESGNLDTSRSQSGVGISTRNQVSKFLAALQQRAEADTRSIFTVKELQEVSEEVGIKGKFYNTLNTLNVQGYLLKKGGNKYQLCSVDF